MPAIEFSRLRTKIELLGRVYASPGQFVKDLSDLYFFYSDMTFQPSGAPSAGTLSAYRAPVVINRELERLLKPLAVKDPASTLRIADLLWQTKKLEPCQLAAGLIGALPIEQSERVLGWIKEKTTGGEANELTALIHEKATAILRKEDPKIWLSTLAAWYQSGDAALRKMAIEGLAPLLKDEHFDNLPIVFDFLEPVFSKFDSHVALALITLLGLLIERSEVETVFMLKQVLKTNPNEDLPRLIRRALPLFSVEGQGSLKAYLREHFTNSPATKQ
jgi:hypothetical protein